MELKAADSKGGEATGEFCPGPHLVRGSMQVGATATSSKIEILK